jgi:hypothetical protein
MEDEEHNLYMMGATQTEEENAAESSWTPQCHPPPLPRKRKIQELVWINQSASHRLAENPRPEDETAYRPLGYSLGGCSGKTVKSWQSRV